MKLKRKNSSAEGGTSYRYTKMIYLPYWCLILILGACLKPELEPLNFFHVLTKEAVVEIQSPAGQVTMRGEVNFAAEGPQKVDEYGFVWTNDRSLLELDQADVQKISFQQDEELTDGHDFQHTLFAENDLPYYYQAYAKLGERLMKGEIRTFSESVDLELTVLTRLNDSIRVRLELSNLVPQTVSDLGFLWSKDDVNPTLESAERYISFGEQLQNIKLDTLVGSFDFNTRYYFRPFFASNGKTVLGETIDYLVEDGWLRGSKMCAPLQEASVTVVGNNAWVLGGTSNNVASSREVYQYNFSEEEWRNCNAGASTASPFKEGLAISWNNMIFYGQGDGIEDWFRFGSGFSISFCNSESTPYVINGLAFVEGTSLYYGTGRSRDEQTVNGFNLTNNFWEISRQSDCYSWRQLAPLPVMDRFMGLRGDWGRQGAISFSYKDTIYVGGGEGPTYELNDLWRFIPPQHSNSSDIGSWEFVGQLPGTARTEAVALSVGRRAFFGTGFNPIEGYFRDLWEFTPDQPSLWTKREPLPGPARRFAIAFGNEQYGFVVGGQPPPEMVFNPSATILDDSWIYVPTTN